MGAELDILRRFIHGGLLDTLTKPSQLGTLITRKAILRIANELGISIPMDNRDWMLRRLAEQSTDLHKIGEFLEALASHLEAINVQYEELASKYPEIAHVLDEYREKLMLAIDEIRGLAKGDERSSN